MSEDISKIADPSTIGLASFGIGLFVLAFVVAGIGGTVPLGVIVPLTLAVALVHFSAGTFGYIKGELFSALAFNLYGLFWFSFGILQLGVALKWWAPDPIILQWFYLAWTIFTAYVFIATLVTNTALILAIGTLLIVFALLFLSALLSSQSLAVYAGYLGIYTALNALYISAAGLLNTMYGRTVLPVGTPWKSPTLPTAQTRSL
ncbi:MAG TPA: acetate uptake transporter [Methylomusa anaerophila]|uniref:Inner membrane protein YaaH n=1 Tax=Methylomusa anaerophila TaxID=1930071 RepID=A0A348AM15_9FIRM|nr:GPR1/FUN34/YaaH family transporter [Methylomusa anaerophila]BBB92113.1 inner membrane protein YaaH [Methylomusa anaerophila]HML87873.1 acetate uptake transporter [Methylomusa anaerophila]